MAENTAPEKVNNENSEKKAEKNQEKKVPFSKSLKSEFAKIIWPSKDDLTRQTIAVVFISVAVGVIISLIDMALGYGINLITAAP